MDLTLIDINNNNTNLIRTTMTMLKNTSIHLFGVTYPKFPTDVPYRFHKGHSALMSAEIFEHLYKLKDVDTYYIVSRVKEFKRISEIIEREGKKCFLITNNKYNIDKNTIYINTNFPLDMDDKYIYCKNMLDEYKEHLKVPKEFYINHMFELEFVFIIDDFDNIYKIPFVNGEKKSMIKSILKNNPSLFPSNNFHKTIERSCLNCVNSMVFSRGYYYA